MKFLVIGPTWVGDTVLATPVLRNLRSAFPEAPVHFLATAWAAGVLKGDPAVSVLHIRPGGLMGDLRIARSLRRERLDWAFILPNSFRGAWLARTAGVRRRIGYAGNGRTWMLTDPVPSRGESNRHQVDEYLALLRAAGVSVTDSAPRLFIGEEADRFADGVFLQAGIHPDRPAVGVQPGAKFGATKLWPAERFAAVGDRLTKSEGARILLLGNPDEKPLTDRIASLMKTPPVNLAGQDRLDWLPAVLRRLNVLLTGDTGPMHIAAAVGTPVVALFGPTDPGHTGPVGRGHSVLRRELFCSPCFLKKCPYGHECMEELSVQDVYEAVREKLRVPVGHSPRTAETNG